MAFPVMGENQWPENSYGNHGSSKKMLIKGGGINFGGWSLGEGLECPASVNERGKMPAPEDDLTELIERFSVSKKRPSDKRLAEAVFRSKALAGYLLLPRTFGSFAVRELPKFIPKSLFPGRLWSGGQ